MITIDIPKNIINFHKLLFFATMKNLFNSSPSESTQLEQQTQSPLDKLRNFAGVGLSLTALSLSLSVSGCASKLAEIDTPKAPNNKEDIISPVTVPVPPQYKPPASTGTNIDRNTMGVNEAAARKNAAEKPQRVFDQKVNAAEQERINAKMQADFDRRAREETARLKKLDSKPSR